MTFEQSLKEAREQEACMASFPQTGERDSRQKKSVLKGPEKGPCLVCSRKNKPANELGSDQHMRSGSLGFAGFYTEEDGRLGAL